MTAGADRAAGTNREHRESASVPNGDEDLRQGDALLGTPSVRRHLVGSVAANLALPLSALITGPLLARTIGAAGRGEIAAVVMPATVAVTLVTAGLNRSIVHHLAADRSRLGPVGRTGLRSAIVAGLVASLGWLALSDLFLEEVSHPRLVRLGVALLIPLVAVGRGGAAVLGSLGRFPEVNSAPVIAAVARLVVLVVLAVAGYLSAASALMAFLVYELALAGLRLVPSVLAVRRSGPGVSSGTERAGVHRFWAWSWLGAASTLVVRQLDIAVLATLVDAESLGFYVYAVSLAGLWAGAVGSLQEVVLPETRRSGDMEAVARLHRIVLGLTVVVIALAFAVAGPVTSLLYGPGFEETARLLPVLLLGLGPWGLLPLSGSILDANGVPGARSVPMVLSAALTVFGLIVVVPVAGVWGAAWVSVVSYFAASAFTTWMAARHGGLTVRAMVVPRVDDFAGMTWPRRAR